MRDTEVEDLEALEIKIAVLSQDDSPEVKEIVKGLEQIREETLKLQEENKISGEDAVKTINNKSEYIREIFNDAISKIISKKLSQVQVKIADLGNACFEVSFGESFVSSDDC